MIQKLADTYKRHVAFLLLYIFYLQFLSPLYAAVLHNRNAFMPMVHYSSNGYNHEPAALANTIASQRNKSFLKPSIAGDASINKVSPRQPLMGGPSCPEATSFKAVGSSNLVNLFTGDFSYSIPLLDVGGYPVNLFYSGGITMEQEASWVGLGWNINPGTVSRNMRGVPDDFNGTDMLTQKQNVKPNRTWGGEVGVDGELLGIKEPNIGLSLGFSYNNYLGPALETGASVSVSLPIMESVKAEKYAAPSVGLSIGAKLSSRSGLTFSPSLSASLAPTDGFVRTGIGLSTSYNSRSGISSLNLHAEQTKYYEQGKFVKDEYRSYKSASSISLGSSSISFSKPSYMPTLRMPMQNTYTSGQVEFGGGAYGIRGAATLNGYYSESKVPVESRIVKKPLVGYMYSEKANTNLNAVMDFNRVNDAEVTPNTPVISAPMYTYDIFSIQGEGTGGSIRAYRGDLGVMHDNVTVSKDANLALGIDLAPPGHYGVNANSISAPTRVGNWESNNNTLRQTMQFKSAIADNEFENYYFRNPGEVTVTSEDMLNRIGRDSLARFQLTGSGANPRIESKLETFGNAGSVKDVHTLVNKTLLAQREKRTQVTTVLTAEEATKVGLEKSLRNYRTGTGLLDTASKTMVFDPILRVSDYRKAHHISEIDVLEQNGMRYVYGIPVYNVTQKDFTFTVDQLPGLYDNLVNFNPANDTSTNSSFMSNSSKLDGYLETKETPAYASSFLLTGLLSPDYVDVTGNGISEDDLGGAVKFNYSMSGGLHKWRTPRVAGAAGTAAPKAHFNEGKRTERKDNKATISYGERESWYLNSIESKSMVAIFKTDPRNDAKGVKNEMDAGINTAENVNRKLTQIDLYTKADLRANGFNNARPVKSVFFDYSYALCKGTPDNNGEGKLTLKSVSFSYNGQPRGNKERYVFGYGALTAQKDNPDYKHNAADRWGTYKPATDSANQPVNPSALNNIDYPYTLDTGKLLNDQFAAAWSLKKILLPSGGQMEIDYEADDYGYVQDRRACNMYTIYGLGNTTAAGTGKAMYSNSLATDNLYVYVKLNQALQNTDPVKRKGEIFAKYLATLKQLAFKLQVNMPKGPEPLTVYATSFDDYGLCSNSSNNDIIYIKLTPLDGKSPLAKSALGFIIENLTGQAFPGYDASGVSSLTDFFGLMGSMLKGISNAFKNAENTVRSDNNARDIVLGKSFVRLCNPGIRKYGGGVRVKRVLVRDNWDKMTQQYVSTYGQDYDYTTKEAINGVATTISSGVASYEPAIGSEENPFREILSFSNKLPLASAQYGAIEMPLLEGFYPSPMVGYSKVTVRSIHRNGTHGDSTVRSAIGKQVTEFYTAKDYPSTYSFTDMASMDYKKDPFFSFFNKEVINRRIISQGFMVTTNDMHGKMKAQLAYSEKDEKTPVSGSFHSYRNTGKNGLNDKVDFVYNNEKGIVHQGNMGVDMELMTDVREFSIESRGVNTMGQVDIFYIGPIPVPVPTVFRSRTFIENKYRAVTCTKLINYHAIEDSVTVMDKGSVISTRTLAYDAETGTPVVTQTANEFNDSIYNISYPAHWAYSGVGLAYKNAGRSYSNVSFIDGRITSGVSDMSQFESGDELFITKLPLSSSITCPNPSPAVSKLWAFDKNKVTTALTVPSKDIVFMDSTGNLFTYNNVDFRILRSGRRNNLGLTVSGITAMKNPLQVAGGVKKLVIDSTYNVVAASAISFKEKWQTDNDVIVKRLYYFPTCSSVEMDSIDCSGILEKKINPYTKGLIGNLKPYRSYTYYGSRREADPNYQTNIRKNGYISNFINFWSFNTDANLVPDTANTKWVWNSELTRINGKGQELETRDALDRYTAAQYGFNKNMPVAMTQNAKYGEAFADGFEDYSYYEALNKPGPYNCTRNYIDLTGQYGSSIVPSDGTVNAHSGKYMMKLNGGAQISQPLTLKAPSNDDFHFNFGKDTVKVLNETGGNSTFDIQSGTYPSNPYTVSYGGSSFSASVNPGNSSNSHRSLLHTYFYISIATEGTYTFQIGIGSYYNNLNQIINYSNEITVSIFDLKDQQKSSTSLAISKYDVVSQPYNNVKSVGYSVDLCAGIYRIESYALENAQQSSPFSSPTVTYSWSCTNSSSPDYKSLSTQNTCISTKPIKASDSMINGAFSIVTAKKMQFSGWVKGNGDIKIVANGTPLPDSLSTIKHSGNVIEGWQKIEGDFVLPPNASSAAIRIVNNDPSAALYVDDIRVHPFNANMKSYVYDPRTLRLIAELDENNYSSFYEYDEEGQLVRAKKETIQGIKTIKETRSAKQQMITDLQ